MGEFVISSQEPIAIDTFEKRREFDHAFNKKYNDIEHAFLWTDTITHYFTRNPDNMCILNVLNREKVLEKIAGGIETPIELHDYRNRLASFPKNLRFLAKKMALFFLKNGITFASIQDDTSQGTLDAAMFPIVEVVIIAVLTWFLIETDNEEIFERIYNLIKHTNNTSLNFKVFFKLIDQSFLPSSYNASRSAVLPQRYWDAILAYETQIGKPAFKDGEYKSYDESDVDVLAAFNALPQDLKDEQTTIAEKSGNRHSTISLVEKMLVEVNDQRDAYFQRRKKIHRDIIIAANQLSVMMGLSGFLKPDSPHFNRMPEQKRQELIHLLYETFKQIRILGIIENGHEPESPPHVMNMFGSHNVKPWQVANAEAVERIRSKMAKSRRAGGKRRKSSNQTQRRKKTMKRSKR